MTSTTYGTDQYNGQAHVGLSPTLGINCGVSTRRNGVVLAFLPLNTGRTLAESEECSPTLAAGTGEGGNKPAVAVRWQTRHERITE